MASKVKPALKTASKKSGAYVSVEEQQELSNTFYNEAVRYMDNAKGYLKQAQKDGNMYRDKKYIKTACGTAYSGVLVALDGYLALKGIHDPPKVRKTVEYYQRNLAKLDKKMLDHYICAYQILHLSGYYDGMGKVEVLLSGFDDANAIVNKIKPASLNGSPRRNGNTKK